MSKKQHGIEWLNRPGTIPESWNPLVGCSIVSPGCTHCYAMRQAARIERMGTAPHYEGLTQASKAGPVWTGTMRQAPDSVLEKPLRWTKPRTIFVNSMSDLFAEEVPDAWIDRVFAVMALAPQHTFLVLTKRAARMRHYLGEHDADGNPACPRIMDAALAIMGDRPPPPHIKKVAIGPNGVPEFGWRYFINLDHWPLRNVWLGVSTERQKEADERIPDLLATPAAVRFVSAEPLLGPIDLTAIPRKSAEGWLRPLGGRFNKIDWVIAGGESGPGARPMHPQWARGLRDQCADSKVPFFFKQWGDWHPDALLYTDLKGQCPPPLMRIGKRAAGHLLDGREHLAWPEHTAVKTEAA